MNTGTIKQSDGTQLRVIRDHGKFEGELVVSRWLWNDANECGYWDDEVSIGEGEGWYGRLDLVDFTVSPDPEIEIEFTPDELAFLRKNAGVIFQEMATGFVWAEYFEDKAAFESHWEWIQTQYNPEEED